MRESPARGNFCYSFRRRRLKFLPSIFAFPSVPIWPRILILFPSPFPATASHSMHRPARGILRISARPATRPTLPLAFLYPRLYSVSATEAPPSLQPHQYTAFERLSTSLSLKQPCFGARGDEVELLTGPEVFYSRLLDMIKGAKRRILISSLYIGAEEGELVGVIGYKPSSSDC